MNRNGAALLVAGVALTIAACGDVEEDLSDASTETSVEPSSSSDTEPEALDDTNLISPDGELHPEIEEVSTIHFDYIFSPVDSLEELAETTDVAVVARATERSEEDGSQDSPPRTHQDFEVVEVISGDIEAEFTVLVSGGIDPNADVPTLVEGEMEPQFIPGDEYLLFLTPTPPDAGDNWWVYGPDTGRYRVEQGEVTGTYADDLQKPAAATDDGAPTAADAVDSLSLVGREIDEIAEDVADADE